MTKNSRNRFLFPVGDWLVVLVAVVLSGGRSAIGAGWFQTTQPKPVNDARFKVVEGFLITKVAGPDLADDIYTLTVSESGEVWASGRGYLKRFVDSNQDGVFESAVQAAAVPKDGAQGLLVEKEQLWFVGDGGLWRWPIDAGQSDRVRGQPEKVLSIKTGGEHTAHAVRRGPDGWLYLLAGNQTPILPKYFDDPDSPVKEPRAGFLMRISPDLKRRQIVAHGFRNAYDFDFNRDGQCFVYDSDGERDIGLPWYRPTRVFRVRPGDDAGWVGVGWKRPANFFDMPPLVGQLGRASPTGVVVCKSPGFPPEFRDAILVGDWTFGRLVVFKRLSNGQYDEGSVLVQAKPGHGFAITDLEFSADGDLLVSVGGRGTRGTVFRVAWAGAKQQANQPVGPPSQLAKINSQQLTPEQLLELLVNPAAEKQDRAIEMAAVEQLVGRDRWLRQLDSDSASRLIKKLHQLLSSAEAQDLKPVLSVAVQIDQKHWLWFRQNALPTVLLKSVHAESDRERLEVAMKFVFGVPLGPPNRLLRLRAAQLVFDGCRWSDDPPLFHGYEPRRKLAAANRTALIEFLIISLSANETPAERHEWGRLAAFVGEDPKLVDPVAKYLRQSIEDSQVTMEDTIHWLACLARVLPRDAKQVDTPVDSLIAEGLVAVNRKLRTNQRDIDRNFFPRLTTLAKRLIEKQPQVKRALAETIPGHPGDEYLVGLLDEQERVQVLDRMAGWIQRHPDEATGGQVGTLVRLASGRHIESLRAVADRAELLPLVVEGLAAAPQPEQAGLFLEALKSRQPGVLKYAAVGLRRLYQKSGDELEPMTGSVAAFTIWAAGRLSWQRPDVSARDQLVLLLQQVLPAQQTDYQPGKFKVDAELQQRQQRSLDIWREAIAVTYPAAYQRLPAARQQMELKRKIAQLDFESGNVSRGEAVYQRLGCAQCHAAQSRLGPRLEGVSTRYSRHDLLASIVDPNAVVPDRYRTTVIETVDGRIISGSIVYDSVAGVVLQTVDGETVTVSQDDLQRRRLSNRSLMPEGLLFDASDQDWADLVRYLETR